MTAVKFKFVLDWTFASSHYCRITFGRGDVRKCRDLILWWWSHGWCTYAEASDAMDLVDAVLDGAADVFAATGET